jgi:hypothetical protein
MTAVRRSPSGVGKPEPATDYLCGPDTVQVVGRDRNESVVERRNEQITDAKPLKSRCLKAPGVRWHPRSGLGAHVGVRLAGKPII